jgi:hypothetical protein
MGLRRVAIWNFKWYRILILLLFKFPPPPHEGTKGSRGMTSFILNPGPGRFISGKERRYSLNRRLCGLTPGLDVLAKRKIACPYHRDFLSPPLRSFFFFNFSLLDPWDLIALASFLVSTVQHIQHKTIDALSGIQTHNPSKPAPTGLRLRPHGHRDRQDSNPYPFSP